MVVVRFCLYLGYAELGKRTVKRLSKRNYATKYTKAPNIVEFFVSDMRIPVITHLLRQFLEIINQRIRI